MKKFIKKVLAALSLFFPCCGLNTTKEEILDLSHLSSPPNFPLNKIENGNHKKFFLFPEKPFKLELGRGSGFLGLDIIRIDKNRSVSLIRKQEYNWQHCSFKLTNQEAKEIIIAILKNKNCLLKKGYHADVIDGIQWILFFSQENNEINTYFNNHFPKEIIELAEIMDKIVTKSNTRKVKWLEFPENEANSQQKELWKRITK